MAQMPEEGRMFQQVDRNWRDVMGATKNDPSVSFRYTFSLLFTYYFRYFQFILP